MKLESLTAEIAKLPEFLQKEWKCVAGFYSSKTDLEIFEEFTKRYDSNVIEECLNMPNVVYNEWADWKYVKGFYYDFCGFGKQENTLEQVWGDFKEFWQYDSEESKLMFKEMELLGKNMIREWRFKYNFTYPDVYEEYYAKYEQYSQKSKAQLWKEFKEIWGIDILDYNEEKLESMLRYISKIECDDKNYRSRYPKNFFEFRENANYHSFDNYSVLEQFEICSDWAQYRK